MQFLHIPNIDAYAILGIIAFFSLIETLTGLFHQSKRSTSDWIQELGGFFVLSGIIKPLIIFSVIWFGKAFFADYENIMQGLPFLVGFAVFLFGDDFLQYWYHRLAHQYDFFWKLHRSHHQAEEMGFFVSYRNAALYYVLMPNLWYLGMLTFLGAGKGILLALVLKQLVIVSSHSTTKWDSYLYKFKFLNPLTWLIEHIIITPAFHFAHHGKSMKDGISNPNGNFGNMFSIWDQFFGTATFTRQYPSELGLENDPKDKWTASYLYPFVPTDKPESELAWGNKKLDTTVLEPVIIHLTAGEKYLWCQCGKSKNQPFCDGSHHGTKFKPMLFEVKKTGNVKLCQCKLTKKGPFCDNSHI